MDVLILRLIHVAFGAFWVGALFTNVLFLQRTATAIGPVAAPFQYHLIRHGRFATAILASAAITIAAGVWLLWITSDGLRADLLFDDSRLGFTVGGIVAILTFGLGAGFVYPRVRRAASVLHGPMTEHRPATPDEGAELARLGRQLATAGWATLLGVALATISMATARYWPLLL